MSIAFSPFSCYNGVATKSVRTDARALYVPPSGLSVLAFRSENNVPAREGAFHWAEPERDERMIPRTAYAYLAIGLIVFWPFIFLIFFPWDIVLVVSLSVLSVALLAFVWHRCSSKECSLLLGMEVISARLASGCAIVSIIYLPAFLIIVYLMSIVYAFIGLFRGRGYSQLYWIKFVYKFVEKEQI